MQNTPATPHAQTQEAAFLRLWQIIGCPDRNIQPLLPIGRTTFLNRVKDGTFPAPVKLGKRTNAWRMSDVKQMLATLNGGQ